MAKKLVKAALIQVYKDNEDKFKKELTQTAFVEKYLPKIDKKPQAPTAYLLWSKDNRDAIKAKNPDMIPTDIMKELGRVWREEVPASDLNKYKEMAEAEKEKLKNADPEEDKDTQDAQKAAKKELKAKEKEEKKPASAYHAYLNKNRETIKKKNPTWTGKEINTHLTTEWNGMTKEAKAEYAITA